MQHPRCKHPVARIEKGPYQGQSQGSSPAGPAPRKGVGIPGEVGHRPDSAERNQAPFHAPEGKGMEVRMRGRRWNAPANTVAVVKTIVGALITQR